MLTDGYGRTVDYLRISVTERCNFRCGYCMPDKPFSWVPKENLLSFEELFLFVKAAIDLGVKKIRITGGEPTVREGLENFIAMIFAYAPTIDLALTSNGYLLGELAQKYATAGLKRVNISLDSLKPDTAAKIAGGKDVLSHVLEGIDAAINAGLFVKMNCVPIKGVNDDELNDIFRFCQQKKVELRFIEFMENRHAKEHFVGLSSEEILKILACEFSFKEADKIATSPAKLFVTDDGYKFGIIEPHKEEFCSSCNRIRLTAEGYLIPCLYFDEAQNIKNEIRAGNIEKAVLIFKNVVANKPEKNRWSGEAELSSRAFYETGG